MPPLHDRTCNDRAERAASDMSLEEQHARAHRVYRKKTAAEEEADRVRAERIASALGGLSRVAAWNITPDFSPPAPDKRQVRSTNLRAGCTSTNLVYRYEPKEAREEYEIAPENHRPKTDLNQFAERALQCGNNPFMRSLPKAGSKAKK